jgi:hypothetical protein
MIGAGGYYWFVPRRPPVKGIVATGPSFWTVAAAKEIMVGMNERQVELAWGSPRTKNVTRVGAGVNAQWVYDLNHTLYFVDGGLVSVQSSDSAEPDGGYLLIDWAKRRRALEAARPPAALTAWRGGGTDLDKRPGQ